MNIIVIEDDPPGASLIREIVEPLGDVSIAYTLEEAMKMIAEAPPGSLMLWDLRLGDSTAENTAEVIRGIKAKDPSAPVVVVSGIHTAPETGADAFVTKGGSLDFGGDLFRAIEKALASRAGYEQTLDIIQRITEARVNPLDSNLGSP